MDERFIQEPNRVVRSVNRIREDRLNERYFLLFVNNNDGGEDIRTHVHFINSLTHMTSTLQCPSELRLSKTVKETQYRNFIKDSVLGYSALIGEKPFNDRVKPYNSNRSKGGHKRQSLISTINLWLWEVNIPRLANVLHHKILTSEFNSPYGDSPGSKRIISVAECLIRATINQLTLSM